MNEGEKFLNFMREAKEKVRRYERILKRLDKIEGVKLMKGNFLTDKEIDKMSLNEIEENIIILEKHKSGYFDRDESIKKVVNKNIDTLEDVLNTKLIEILKDNGLDKPEDLVKAREYFFRG